VEGALSSHADRQPPQACTKTSRTAVRNQPERLYEIDRNRHQQDVHHRVLIRLLPVLSAMAVVACGSSPTGSVYMGGSTTSVTTSSVVSSIGSTETVTATAPPTSTVGPDPATTAPTTITSPPAPITTVAPPLPVEGTGVRGRVTAGPTCPVERPEQPCPPNPVHGRVDALDATGRTVADVTIDASGRYAISLPPGQYTLRVRADGPFPRCPDTAVSVTEASPVTSNIGCDTGIR
jgi:hypothetical protein